MEEKSERFVLSTGTVPVEGVEEILQAICLLPVVKTSLVLVERDGEEVDIGWSDDHVESVSRQMERDPLRRVRFAIEYDDVVIAIANAEEANLLQEEGYWPIDILDLAKIFESCGRDLPTALSFEGRQVVVERAGRGGDMVPVCLYLL